MLNDEITDNSSITSRTDTSSPPENQENSSSSSLMSNDCFICMENKDEPVLNILDFDVARTCECSAKLHAKCYAQWLLTSVSCPVCRNQINTRLIEIPHSNTVNTVNLDDFVIDRLPNIILNQNRHSRAFLLCEYTSIIIVFGIMLYGIIYFVNH